MWERSAGRDRAVVGCANEGQAPNAAQASALGCAYGRVHKALCVAPKTQIAIFKPLLRRYVLSTSLSLWNKMLVGKGRGLFGKGPFPGTLRQRGSRRFVWLYNDGGGHSILSAEDSAYFSGYDPA